MPNTTQPCCFSPGWLMEVQAFNFDSTVVGFNFQVRADAFWVIALSSASFITPC